MIDSTRNIRFVLLIEKQRIKWQGAESIPEVDIAHAHVLDSYSTEDIAIGALKNYLCSLGAKLTWADVRPIEECAICGKDFDTSDWHKAVVLSSEAGTEECPVILGGEYPARFCTNCGEDINHG